MAICWESWKESSTRNFKRSAPANSVLVIGTDGVWKCSTKRGCMERIASRPSSAHHARRPPRLPRGAEADLKQFRGGVNPPTT